MPGTVQRSFEGTLSKSIARVVGTADCDLREIDTIHRSRSILVHPHHVLLATVKGGGPDVSVTVDGAAAYRGPKLTGAAAYFPRGRRVESVWPATRLRYLLVTIPHDGLEELADRALQGDDWHAAANLADPLIQSAMAELGRVVGGPSNPVDDLLADALVSTLQLKLIQRHSGYGDPTTGATGSLRQALDLVEDRIGERITIADLCAASGMPRGRLSRAFRDQTGSSPHQYVIKRRLDRACQLLATTDLRVQDIATRLGFASGSHLTALLQQHLNLCPRTIRHRSGRI